MKRCGHCGVEKPFSDFARNRARTDGYAPQCKTCLNAFNRDYQSRNTERHAVKRCTKCGEIKPIAEYGRKSQTASGLHSWCKGCVKADNDQRVAAIRMARLQPVDGAQKTCTGCGVTKPVAQFYRQSSQRDGLNPRCKPCVNAYNHEYHDRNRERMNQWRSQATVRRWAKSALGLSQEDYEECLAKANGHCEVCGRPESSVSRNGNRFTLAFDHDHTTMKFRGMLCRPCNTALGCANEDPALLRKLADYLDAGGIQFS